MKGVFMTKEVKQRVDLYQPVCLSRREWAIWGPSVLDIVYEISPETVDQATRIVGLLARFCVDAERWGWDPPLAQHLTVRSIGRHVGGFSNDGTRRTRRHSLISIGRVVNPAQRWPPVEPVIGRSSRQPPYSRTELMSLHEGATHWEPISHRRMFQVALALCLGAGLDGRLVHSVTPERVERVGQAHVVVRQSDTRPSMTIKGIHGQWLAYWAANTEPDHPVIGPRGTYNGRLYTLFGSDGKTRMSMSRLRTTFVVHLLTSPSLSQSQILQLSGLKSTSSLDMYREFVTEPDLTDTERAFAALPSIYNGGK